MPCQNPTNRRTSRRDDDDDDDARDDDAFIRRPRRRMIRARAHPARNRVLARYRRRADASRGIARARDDDDDDDARALEREFARLRETRDDARTIPLSPRERAALANEWSLECKQIGLRHLEACFRARADARASETEEDDDRDVGGDDGDWNG